MTAKKKIKITAIHPNERNPRRIQAERLQALVKSIQDFPEMMELRPIVIDAGGTILGGNQRYRACIEAGMTELPAAWVVRADKLTDQQRRRFVVIDNENGFGEWDLDILAADFTPGDLAEWGVHMDQLNKYLQAQDRDGKGGGAKAKTDQAAELRKKWKTAPGQLWILGRHRLICGDSTVPEIWTRLMDQEKAQLVFTDPPYGVEYQDAGGRSIQNDDKARNELAHLVAGSLKCQMPHTTDTAAFYVWHASSTRRDFEHALDIAGLEEKQYITWVKDSFVLGRADYHWQTEPCFYCQKSGHTAAFFGRRDQATVWRITRTKTDDDTMAIGNGLLISDGADNTIMITRKPPKGKKCRHIRLEPDQAVRMISEQITDAWEIKREGKAGYMHPNQKPTDLAERALLNSTQPNDIVLDGFAGSGSTLLAAERTMRQARVVEMDPGYAAVILERYQEETGETPKQKPTHK